MSISKALITAARRADELKVENRVVELPNWLLGELALAVESDLGVHLYSQPYKEFQFAGLTFKAAS